MIAQLLVHGDKMLIRLFVDFCACDFCVATLNIQPSNQRGRRINLTLEKMSFCNLKLHTLVCKCRMPVRFWAFSIFLYEKSTGTRTPEDRSMYFDRPASGHQLIYYSGYPPVHVCTVRYTFDLQLNVEFLYFGKK